MVLLNDFSSSSTTSRTQNYLLQRKKTRIDHLSDSSPRKDDDEERPDRPVLPGSTVRASTSTTSSSNISFLNRTTKSFFRRRNRRTRETANDPSSTEDSDDSQSKNLRAKSIIVRRVTQIRQYFSRGGDSCRRFIVIVAYVCMWTFFYVLVHHHYDLGYPETNNGQRSSEAVALEEGNQKHHDALTSSAVFIVFVEFVKLIFSTILYLRSPQSTMKDIFRLFYSKDTQISLRVYAPTALLYAIYNNLMFLNLKNNEPTFYLVMSSSRLVMTAIVWQKFFKTPISYVKKIAILMITLGIFGKNLFSQEEDVHSIEKPTIRNEWTNIFSYTDFNKGMIIILLQMLCSVFAGIFNECLLKNINCNQHLQNICLYINSIAFNLVVGIVRCVINYKDRNFMTFVEMILTPVSLLIISILALVGILTSTLLRYENSVTKGVASASETVLTSMIEYLRYGQHYKLSEIFGIFLVSAGTVIYSISPALMTKAFNLPRFHKLKRPLICLGVSCIFISNLHQYNLPTEQHESGSSLCSISANYRSRPDDVSIVQYEHVAVAENIISHIVKELHQIEAPVSLMYGTLLHEYRNGTGPCVQTNFYDKDFDISVFPPHFHLILGMVDYIRDNFGWTVKRLNRERMFLTLIHPHQKVGKGFQIDVYGFEVNRPSVGLIYFPWDNVTLRAQTFLPLVRHKSIPYNSSLSFDQDSNLFFYRPFNVPCLLENLYGSDYMTPKKGHFLRNIAYDNPACTDQNLNEEEQLELDRQLTFGDFNFHTRRSINSKSMDETTHDIGLITCIETRDDVTFAFELAHSFHNLTTSEHAKLEVYHNAILSPYLTATLEILSNNIRVIQLEQTPGEANSCVQDALSLTKLYDVILLEPSLVLLAYDPLRKRRVADVTHSQIICSKSFTNGTSRKVTSTSQRLDDAVHLFLQSKHYCEFDQANFFMHNTQRKSIVKQEIMLDDKSTTIGSIYISDQISFIYPKQGIFEWSSHYIDSSVFYCRTEELVLEECDVTKSIDLLFALRRRRSWKSLVLLDRQVGWIAFDGGLVPSRESSSCYSFNSVKSAKRSLEAIHSDVYSTMLNIDLVMTRDNENIAMHSFSSFNPIVDYLPSLISPSEMTLSEMQKKVRHPCLSRDTIRAWLDDNPYRFFNACNDCLQEISTVNSFLDEIVLKANSSVIFDLKASGRQTNGMISQAEAIADLIYKYGRNKSDLKKIIDNVNLRFFGEDADGSAKLEVLPTQLYGSDTISPVLRQLGVYMNAPSKENCFEILNWSRHQNNKTKIAGCFVIENHIGLKDSWKTLSRRLNTSKSLVHLPFETKIICDVPREQKKPDLNLWKQGLIDCIERGYEWIHAPFPVGSIANYSPIASKSIFSVSDLKEDLIQSTLSSYILKSNKSGQLFKYWSHWGITSPYNWLPHQQQWSFIGFNHSESRHTSMENKLVFRCVTKILTVMLFLRLEELELVSVDDIIVGPVHNVTWKHLFTNTAGIDGSYVGRKFEYSNSLWLYIPNFIHSVTGVPFIDAITFYVLNPMGLSGFYDMNTSYPPYAARGFLGTTRDIILIGSTLASGGISPETRLRVLSQSSVKKMLEDWTSALNVTHSFNEDKTVQSMSRFYNSQQGNDPLSVYGVVDGYAMGLWRVKGWRTRKGMIPVRGWIAMGSSEALLYFDEDDIVVGMCAPNRTLGLELTAAFASTIQKIGVRIDESFRKVSLFSEQEDHQSAAMKKLSSVENRAN